MTTIRALSAAFVLLLASCCCLPPKTVRLDPLQGINTTPIAVPIYARTVSLWRNNYSTVSVRLWFTETGGEIAYIYDLAIGANMLSAVPIAAGVTTIGVQKTDGADTEARVIFNP